MYNTITSYGKDIREMLEYDKLSREDLIKIIEMHAKNWLAHDGCWFLAAEEKYGMDAAIELDIKSWERFTVAEAGRIKKDFSLPESGGLDALAEALKYRIYATVNEQEIERPAPGRMVFTMKDCKVQSARRRKKLPDFPCKKVGLVEYTGFASTIDARIRTAGLRCPPDELREDQYCQWEFTIEE